MIKKKRTAPKLVSGLKAGFIQKRLVLFLLWQVQKSTKNIWRTFREVKKIRKLRASVHGNQKLTKFIKSDNQYYWATENAGFPSCNLKNNIQMEFQRNTNAKANIPQQTIIWGITNRCMLNCKHCYDWDNIDKKDQLNLEQLKIILAKIEQQGIRHVQLSGGEPLLRFDDLKSILKEASKRIDFWLLTSGFGLTLEKAKALKEAGLKGVNISLDHWNKNFHNDFRNNSESYNWVLKSIQNCRNSGIMVSLSLCATREFTTKENLDSYLNLAKKEGAHFVRILEPRKVGKFADINVKLSNEQIKIISEFAIRTNTHPDYKDFPIVVFFGYHQRKLGCMGAGNRYLYIDSMGEIHACPFCQNSVGNILEISLDKAIIKLRQKGCHAFNSYLAPNQSINNQQNHHKQIEEVEFIK